MQSKKIVYIGHSYHAKTKSTRFLIDFLNTHFEVTEVLDDSWQGKPFPDLSFIDQSYVGVIFFQMLPDPVSYKTIKNDNLICFPMYDYSRQFDKTYYLQFPNLKIINFSRTLHSMFAKWGFDSMYIQYFPKPLEFVGIKRLKKAFLWQRINTININTLETLFGNENVHIHLHTAVDPNFSFIKPSKEQERQFKITYSNWFKTRQEMQQVMRTCNLYIAPREFEGIGLSFLEALAMGQAVIAADNPTMNEYIVHNQTGYLMDINHPQPLDLSNLHQIQKNTHEFMRQGYIKWNQSKLSIIQFIKQR